MSLIYVASPIISIAKLSYIKVNKDIVLFKHINFLTFSMYCSLTHHWPPVYLRNLNHSLPLHQFFCTTFSIFSFWYHWMKFWRLEYIHIIRFQNDLLKLFVLVGFVTIFMYYARTQILVRKEMGVKISSSYRYREFRTQILNNFT